MPIKRIIHKRHFQLIEILIALFLVATCAIPVMGSFVSIYLEQRKMQDEIELDHLIHLAYAQLVESLYREGVKGSSLKALLNEERISLALSDEWQASEKLSKYLLFYKLIKEKPVKKIKNKLLLRIEVWAQKNDDPQSIVIALHTFKACIERIFKEGQDEFSEEHT